MYCSSFTGSRPYRIMRNSHLTTKLPVGASEVFVLHIHFMSAVTRRYEGRVNSHQDGRSAPTINAEIHGLLHEDLISTFSDLPQ